MRYEAESITPQKAAHLVRAISTRRDREAFKDLFNFYAPRIKAMLMRGGVADEIAGGSRAGDPDRCLAQG